MSLSFAIALPRAGKSSYGTSWAQEAPMRAIVCADDIRRALTGSRFNPLTETMVFAVKHSMIRALLLRGYDVFVDGTHSSPESLLRLFEIDPDAQPILFNTPKEVCIERAIATKQRDLIPVIERIDRQIEALGVRTGDFSKIDSVRQIVRDRKANYQRPEEEQDG